MQYSPLFKYTTMHYSLLCRWIFWWFSLLHNSQQRYCECSRRLSWYTYWRVSGGTYVGVELLDVCNFNLNRYCQVAASLMVWMEIISFFCDISYAFKTHQFLTFNPIFPIGNLFSLSWAIAKAIMNLFVLLYKLPCFVLWNIFYCLLDIKKWQWEKRNKYTYSDICRFLSKLLFETDNFSLDNFLLTWLSV